MIDLERFYKGKRVFITGHTGFKGSWLVKILSDFGADVCGYALAPVKGEMFEQIHGETLCRSVIGDVADFDSLFAAVSAFKPQIVLHLAAQPIVLESYRRPRETFLTNVMGTVNLLECVRLVGGVKSFVNVTTDKVYKNSETGRAFSETDELGGFDPYSNSKSCSELVTACFKGSFLAESGTAVSTVRAGNVIGGGDYAADRIIPDCVRAAKAGEKIFVRNPSSVRPYQHVLEPLFAYLTVAAKQYENPELASSYNVGPGRENCVTTGELAETFCKAWKGAAWYTKAQGAAYREANFLMLDNAKIRATFGIEPVWGIQKAVEKTVEWFLGDPVKETEKQIKEFAAAWQKTRRAE